YFKSTVIAFIVISMTSCSNEKNDASESKEESNNTTQARQTVFDKLVGSWQSEDGKSFEQWTKKDDGTFRSVAFSVKGSDTSWNENAKIYPENDKWIFENKVNGQNEGKAVKFTSSILTDNTVQFSNPAHDFPTDVNYTVADADTVHAFIVGPNDKGGKDTIPFNYTRMHP
ncbi:MAG TPA: hypothetical protein VI461_12410, partial [Chitinophagaceae bacterium]|nr:hypothetical protein [Chitinophagaceae bacterium]